MIIILVFIKIVYFFIKTNLEKKIMNMNQYTFYMIVIIEISFHY